MESLLSHSHLDQRYAERGDVAVRLLDQSRSRVRLGLQSAVRQAFLNSGYARVSSQGALQTDAAIVSLGCGDLFVEEMVFGRNLSGITENGAFYGFDLTHPKAKPKPRGEIRGNTNILEMNVNDLPKGDVLFGGDFLSSIPPTPDNLNKITSLIGVYLSRYEVSYLDLLTFPASSDWWSPSLIVMNYKKPSDIDDLVKKEKSRKGIYLLGPEDLVAAAEAIFPFNVFTQVKNTNNLTAFWRHCDDLMEKYIVNGEDIWGARYSSENTAEVIHDMFSEYDQGSTNKFLAQEFESTLDYIHNIEDYSNPIHIISAAYGLVNRFTEFGDAIDNITYKNYSPGSAYARTFDLIGFAFQVAAYQEVYRNRFQNLGFQWNEAAVDGSPAVTNEKSARLRGDFPQTFPLLVLNTNLKRMADRVDWLVGYPLYSRQRQDRTNVIQKARVVSTSLNSAQ
ncbi:hypothetical protein HY357_04455 [Candidatus Roizmanbacteria bacterium]|nr:hypothetical protein [Candidatus Roizmanbacteria bacterium]